MKDTSDNSPIDQALTALDSYVLLGKSGLRVSPLSLGTMTFGDKWGFGNNKETCRKIFDTYYERGGNFFDTANVYMNGDSERFLGEYISSKRSGCVIATKYSINAASLDAIMGRGQFNHPNPNAGGNHRKNLVETLDGSLKRMGMGYVDILYVHLWEYRTPIYEVMRALDDVIRAGKALYVAVSDTPSWVVPSANTMADLRGLTPFIGFQTRYNLLNRSLESDIQPMCADMGIGIVPWSILAEGFLTGKHLREQINKDSKREGQVDIHFKHDRNWRILDEVKAIAQECNRTPAQVAVNWILQKPGITSPLIGARTLEQLKDNLNALEFTLKPSQMARLDSVSNPKQLPFPQDLVKDLDTFIGIGVDIEVPRQFQALFNLRTSKM
ncbi:aldo/keto reductase [Lobosporangium transversale]|uniref:Aldo/keto reductase n=1 Tax=Lobosporangium transversale TaxID=64571 RepID=A0A1Y2GGH6_9FUNG|nr:aldo/keto reductase [Lobosporangium transversale]ORZ10070.1 aldo/keto reductase [Lobosporangium transversale]|eukprot:XP_021879160.1 aldo/keto reductase [Lobosporangium transversale]